MSRLKKVVDRYMQKVPEVKGYCERCLATRRWNGNAVLMVVDAAFTSIGLNYFQAVVPKVEEFERAFVRTGKIKSMEDLASADAGELKKVWKNERSWRVAKGIASYLSSLKKKNLSDREALIKWARNSSLGNWKNDAIGRIDGVGINTFQYLRMMGGVDTAMPDKIVKRMINKILKEAGRNSVEEDLAFIETVHEISKETGYKAIELCWMTWLVQSEGGKIRIQKYSKVLPKI
ncbi:MAG: hypothetical protein ABH874_06530 [Methanobacteriota archaeon]